MSELFPGSSPEKAESFSTKKEAIVAYLQQQLRDKRAQYDSFEETQKRVALTPPVAQIPNEALKDGGADLVEWRAQVGSDRQRGDRDDERDLDYLGNDISRLERDLEFVGGLEDYPTVPDEPDGDHDARVFEELYQEAKSKE